MVYHCDNWTQNIPQIEGGELADSLYATYACDSFSENATATVDRYGNVQDTTAGDAMEGYCNDHDREVYWKREGEFIDYIEDLSEAYLVCTECDEATVWTSTDSYEEHREADHDDAWRAPSAVPFHPPTGTHARWTST